MVHNIFVIIVTYNGMKWYERCFDSLYHSSIPVSIIAIDNASSDNTVNYIREHYPDVILIENKENLGFGKANNLGFRYAIDHDCDYVFLLNQDTWLIDYNTIEELILIHKAHPEYGILSPMHLKSDEKELWMLWENENNLCSTKLVSDLYCHTMKDVYETNYVNAAAWLLPRKTLETIGGFDPIFEHYEEDDDYLNRVRFHGLKIGVCPSVRIVHDHHSDFVNPFETHSRYHHNQQLLVRMNDINKNNSIQSSLRYLIRKTVMAFISGQFEVAKRLNADLKFIWKKRKAIRQHRSINMTSGPSWIGQDTI